jgi:hypothetical protein
MRYVFRFGFALALSLVLGCGGGEGGFPCTEQGIRDAITEGGGPHTFDCDGAQTVVTEFEIVIDNDVILDGEGNLTVDGDEDHRMFWVRKGVVAELRGFLVTGGTSGFQEDAGGINNNGTLTLINSTVSGNSADYGDLAYGGGVTNYEGTLTLINSTVSGNSAARGGGIYNYGGTLTLTNSTVSGNTATGDLASGGGISHGGGDLTLINSTVSGNTAYSGGGIHSGGTPTLINSTVSGNTATSGGGINYSGTGTLMLISSTVSGNSAAEGGSIRNLRGTVTLTNTLVEDDCQVSEGSSIVSLGHNIESPGDTCGFDQATDQVNVTAEQLNLGPLQDNGGPTMTYALGAGSVAIDWIPAEDCVDADGQPLTTDQRGEPRPAGSGCDVGAFEVQP